MSETPGNGTTNRGAQQNVSYEVGKLDAFALTYPEEMREPFLWLGGYVREECARKLDVLEAKVHALGFTTTKDTFSKIFRGRWRLDAKGAKVTPIMALANFLQVVERLKAESALAALSGSVPFVETGTWDLIRNYIDIRRARDHVCKFGLIIGPTGSQKTACSKQYALRNNHGMCTWNESPERPNFSQFITDLSVHYGASRHQSQGAKKICIRKAVNNFRTIIMENVQRLYDGAQELVSTVGMPIFNYLQKLQEETGCTIILTVTPEFYTKFTAGIASGYFEQFIGRCGGVNEFLKLPGYTPRADIIQIATAFGLSSPAKHINYLEDISRRAGRVRILFQALQNAKQEAMSNGEPLAIEHVYEVMGEQMKEAA